MSKDGRGKDCVGYLKKTPSVREGIMNRIVCKREKLLDFTEGIIWSLLKMQNSSSLVGMEARFLFLKVIRKEF